MFVYLFVVGADVFVGVAFVFVVAFVICCYVLFVICCLSLFSTVYTDI